MTDDALDVLVVGAGPTGLTMASQLVRHGVRMRIVDRLAEPAGIAKATSIMPRTLELLGDLDCRDAFLDAGVVTESMAIYADADEPLTDLSFESIDSPHPYVLCLPQSETERLLTGALERAGGRVERGVEVVELEEFDDFIRVVLTEGGRRETVRVRYVVGCDGAHSFVRHALGFTFPGGSYPEDFALGDVRIDWDIPHDRIVTFLVDSGFVFAAPLPGDRWLMVADLAGDQARRVHDGEPTLADLQQLVDERVRSGGRVSDPVWTSFFRIHHRQVEQYSRDRVFLAGDAAHIHSPLGGQGMNTGIQDAYNLAWKLGLVLRRGGRPELLESYDAERRPVGKAVLGLSHQLQLSSSFRNRALQGVRDAVISAIGHIEVVGHHVAGQLGETLYSYRHGPLAGEHHDRGFHLHADARHPDFCDCRQFSHGPRSGDRAPDAALAGARLFDVLGGGKFTLLLFEGTHASADERGDGQALLDRIASSLPVPTEAYLVAATSPEGAGSRLVLHDRERQAHDAYGARGQCLYLIRPDGYIAYRSQPVDEDRLDAFVRERLCA